MEDKPEDKNKNIPNVSDRSNQGVPAQGSTNGDMNGNLQGGKTPLKPSPFFKQPKQPQASQFSQQQPSSGSFEGDGHTSQPPKYKHSFRRKDLNDKNQDKEVSLSQASPKIVKPINKPKPGTVVKPTKNKDDLKTTEEVKRETKEFSKTSVKPEELRENVKKNVENIKSGGEENSGSSIGEGGDKQDDKQGNKNSSDVIKKIFAGFPNLAEKLSFKKEKKLEKKLEKKEKKEKRFKNKEEKKKDKKENKSNKNEGKVTDEKSEKLDQTNVPEKLDKALIKESGGKIEGHDSKEVGGELEKEGKKFGKRSKKKKGKKKLVAKIIVLVFLLSFSVGGFFVYKNFGSLFLPSDFLRNSFEKITSMDILSFFKNGNDATIESEELEEPEEPVESGEPVKPEESQEETDLKNLYNDLESIKGPATFNEENLNLGDGLNLGIKDFIF